MIDPFPYDGPIARADGTRPYNRYLWPLEEDWFWANKVLGHRISGRFEFSVVALADGRWSTSGFVWDIERGEDSSGRRTVFPTRKHALRHSAARLIRLVRSARRWSGPDCPSEEDAQAIIRWIGETLEREIARFTHRPILLRPLPIPPRATGMPLFDFEGAA